MITLEALKSQLDYNPETGDFAWKVTKRGKGGIVPGKIAGRINPNGYRYIKVNQKQITAHRLAWFYVNGEWPKHDIDHIDRNRLNNRIGNLRDVPRVVNLFNSARKGPLSGFAGVRAMGDRFRASINVNGKMIGIGSFATAEEAHEAFKRAHVDRYGANSQYYKAAA